MTPGSEKGKQEEELVFRVSAASFAYGAEKLKADVDGDGEPACGVFGWGRV